MTDLRAAVRPGLSRRLVVGVTAAASIAASVTLSLPAPAQAQGDATAVQSSIVSSDPAGFTPFVKDGVVESVVKVGNTMIIGGTFTQVIRGTTTFTRTGLAAFDATTGVVSTTFAPNVNGEVTSLEVGADGTSVYIGGAFNTVNGVTRKKVALVRVSDGSLVTSFKATGISSSVADLRRVGGTLWIAGQFATVNSLPRKALATLDATTGALTDQSTLVFAGLHNGGTTNIRELAVTPDHTRLIAIGNFTSVAGQPRDQAVLIDISGPTAVLSGWQTNFFTSTCSSSFDTFMRDVAVSPDGTYAVFTTTGAYRANTSCDTITRFDITGTSAGVTPTWINMTGGDTTTAVAIVGSVIYIGGHFRWTNNASAADRAGQGAVARTGLAALDPVNGLPYEWNPTRERGYGVYDFLATPDGLWVGSDTDLIGDSNGDGIADGFHPRIAFFPLAGGTAIPSKAVGSLPGDVLSVGPGSNGSDAVSRTDVNAAAVPGSTSPMTTSDTWSHARGAMLVGSTLYTAWDDRRLYASPVSGTSVGARTVVNVNVVFCTTSSGSCAGAFTLDTPSITGMFYDSGRVYYTMTGSSSLFYRYFEPQSGLVGATRFTATGAVSTLNPSRVRGMFLSGGLLYFADGSNGQTGGRLYSIGFSNGVVGSTLVQVDATRDWRARGLALRAAPAANQKPHADIATSCAFLVCQLDGTGSSDVDGSVASYAWDFGDGVSDTGATPQHTYETGGTYTVSLTVTDNVGATDTTTKDITVADVPVSNVSFRASATATASGGAAKVTIPGTTVTGDELLLFITANADTAFTPPASWTQVGEQKDGTPDMVTRVYSRAAVATDAGALVSVGVASGKSVTTLLVYSGVDTSVAPVVASAAEPATTTSHAAPSVTVALPGSWVVSYWGDKGAGTTSWTVPGSQTQRTYVSAAIVAGTVSGASADSGGPVPTGTWSGVTATASTSTGKATSFSIVLASS